jgi:predicted nuclease with RNAse H fold
MSLFEVSLTIKVHGVRVIDDHPEAAGEKAARMVANDLNRKHEVIELAVVDVEGGGHVCNP